MFQVMMITLTAISGLGIIVLVSWAAMSEAKVMERCRRLVLLVASIPLSLLTIWWVSHQLESHVPKSLDPNAEITGSALLRSPG